MWSQIGVESLSRQKRRPSSTRTTTRQVPGHDELLDERHHRSGRARGVRRVVRELRGFGTGWQNPEAQDLANKGAAETDPAKRKEIYFRIQEIVNEDAPMVSLYHKPYVDVTTTRVHNLSHPPTGQYDFLKTWIDQ